MAVALAELPVSALADICVKRPQTSTRPLWKSEYCPPGTSQTSKIRTGVDAERIFNATVGQHTHVLQQLDEAERNARDALFALEMVEMELVRKAAAMKSTLSHLSETLSPYEFEKMCGLAFDQSKNDWEKVWKHEWVEGGTERHKFKRPSGPLKRQPRSSPSHPPPAHHPPSSPLPPSSPPPPSSPLNLQSHLPLRNSLVGTNGISFDEPRLPTHPRSPPTLDGFRAPGGFVDNFGSTRYQPTAPEPVAGPSRTQESRRLRRDFRRLGVDRDGTLVLVDHTTEIEAQRREIRKRTRLQVQRGLSVQAEISLSKIVQRKKVYRHNRMEDPPVTWFRAFEGKEPRPNDLANPFAQDDHVPPPVYPEWDGGKQGPESETNP